MNTETTTNNPFVNLLQQILSQSAGSQSQANININDNGSMLDPRMNNGNFSGYNTTDLNIYFYIDFDHVTAQNLMERLGNIMQMLGNDIHVGFLSDGYVKS